MSLKYLAQFLAHNPHLINANAFSSALDEDHNADLPEPCELGLSLGLPGPCTALVDSQDVEESLGGGTVPNSNQGPLKSRDHMILLL